MLCERAQWSDRTTSTQPASRGAKHRATRMGGHERSAAMTTHLLAKALMKVFPVFPASPEENFGDLQEVFRHDSFLKADAQRRAALMLESSRCKYESEIAYPWDNYFGMDLRPLLAGKEALDLGCFTGGRGVAWG